MIHKFVIELTDDIKGYQDDIERLEREYGIEPIEEHDKQIIAETFKDYVFRDCESCEAHLREQIRAEALLKFSKRLLDYDIQITKEDIIDELCFFIDIEKMLRNG